MKLIKPRQISGEIMTLIEEADQELIIVSPYCSINEWQKLKNAFNYAKNSCPKIEFYVREGENKTIDEVKQLGLEPILIKNLHTKLYINENYAIVASMNLVFYSDNNSLDIAYKTETDQEYDEIIEYYKRYLKRSNNVIENNKKLKKDISVKYNHSSKTSQGQWVDYLESTLEKHLDQTVNLFFEENKLIIQCRNRYECFIYDGNKLAINGILTQSETNLLKENISKFQQKSNLAITLDKSHYNLIWHHSMQKIISSHIDDLYKGDYNDVINIIINFVLTLEDFKDYHYSVIYNF